MRYMLSLLLACNWLHAAETYVVSAGVEKYDDERIASLRYAVADAKSVASTLRASGTNPRNVTLLTSDDPDASHRPTRISLVTALERIKEKATPGDKVIFFFAGHGVQEGEQQYLLTVDTRRSLLRETALPMTLVSAALDGLQAKEVLFIIDACRNEPNAGRADADAKLTDEFARGLLPSTLVTSATKPDVVATLLACDVGQRAWEDPEAGHGVFTTFLLRGLAGTAASPDGQVRLSSLAGYVQKEVGDWARRQGKAQVPRLLNPGGKDMVVTVPPPEPVVSVSFANQPLAAIVQMLAEQYNAQIAIGQGVDVEQRLTGKLDNQPLSKVLQVLLVAAHLRVRREGRVYIVEGEAAPGQAVQVARTKGWRLDASRHLIDDSGKRVLPLAVDIAYSTLSAASASLWAQTLKGAGVELVWLQIEVGNVTAGAAANEWSPPDAAGLDSAIQALAQQDIKAVILPQVQPDKTSYVTEPSAGIWSKPEDQARYLAMLQGLASRYAGERDTLIGLGLLSDPNPGDPAVWSDLAGRAMAAIHKVDPSLIVFATPPFSGKEASWQLPLPFNAMIGGWSNGRGFAKVVKPGEGAILTVTESSGTWEKLKPKVDWALEQGYIPCLWSERRPSIRHWLQLPPEFAGFKQAVEAWRQR